MSSRPDWGLQIRGSSPLWHRSAERLSQVPQSGLGGGGGNVGIGSGHIETPGEFTLIIDNPSDSHTKLP